MASNYDAVTSGHAEKQSDGFGTAGSFQPANEKEAESQRRGSTILPDGRKLSRIGPPPGSLKAGSDTDAEDVHGRLVEMEAGNAIKYRTCSWQKVYTPSLFFVAHSIPLYGLNSVHLSL